MALRTHSPDLGLDADRAGSLQQRGAHLRRGHGRGPGPHPVAAHQRPGRGHRPAHGLLGAHRPQHPALPAGRDRHLPHGRSLGRLLVSGEPDRRAACTGPGSTSRRWRSWAAWPRPSSTGLPKLRIEEAAARRQAHIDSGQETIVGVNKYRLDQEDPLEILEVDNTEVRRQQVARLETAAGRARRPRRWQAALTALTRCAETGEGNLLALAVEAARARATLGEISRRPGEGLRAGTRPRSAPSAASTAPSSARRATSTDVHAD